MRVVYDASVKPAHGAKLAPALREQFGKGAKVTVRHFTAAGKLLTGPKGAHHVRIIVELPE